MTSSAGSRPEMASTASLVGSPECSSLATGQPSGLGSLLGGHDGTSSPIMPAELQFEEIIPSISRLGWVEFPPETPLFPPEATDA